MALLTGWVLAPAAGCFEAPDNRADGTDGADDGATDGSGPAGDDAMDDGGGDDDSDPPGATSVADDGTGGGTNDSGDTDQPNDSATSNDTGDPTQCAGGGTCVSIPEGFLGPIAARFVAGNAETPGCGGAFDDEAFVGFGELVANDAQCTCECDAPTDLVCPDATMTQYPAGTQNCSTLAPVNTDPLVAGCNDIPYYDDVRLRLNLPDLDLSGESCDPQFTSMVPEALWTTQVAACQPSAELGMCDAGACVPDIAADEQLCVWTPGDVECTDDVFTERTVVYDGVADDRACSMCECGDPEGNCTATMTLRSGEGCTVGSPGSGGPGMCVSISTPARSADLTYDPIDVGCMPSGGQAVGSATPEGATTICCTP